MKKFEVLQPKLNLEKFSSPIHAFTQLALDCSRADYTYRRISQKLEYHPSIKVEEVFGLIVLDAEEEWVQDLVNDGFLEPMMPRDPSLEAPVASIEANVAAGCTSCISAPHSMTSLGVTGLRGPLPERPDSE